MNCYEISFHGLVPMLTSTINNMAAWFHTSTSTSHGTRSCSVDISRPIYQFWDSIDINIIYHFVNIILTHIIRYGPKYRPIWTEISTNMADIWPDMPTDIDRYVDEHNYLSESGEKYIIYKVVHNVL